MHLGGACFYSLSFSFFQPLGRLSRITIHSEYHIQKEQQKHKISAWEWPGNESSGLGLSVKSFLQIDENSH